MVSTQNEEALKALLASEIRVTKYFTYPTGTHGDTYIHEEDRTAHEGEVSKLFTEAFQAAAKAFGLRMPYPDSPPDNKVAVELEASLLVRPVYLSWYDGRKAICYRLDTSRGGSTHLLPEPSPLLPWDSSTEFERRKA
jgi:hypothetical protein